jgi:thiol-disulfide isomerase/thioredoxin
MKRILLLVVGLAILIATPSQAKNNLELLMFSNPHCGYCQSFLNEVKPTYHDSKVGKLLPLRVINMDQPVPDWYDKAYRNKRISQIRGTPTFIIWQNDTELYKFVGYPGKKRFYDILNQYVNANLDLFGKDGEVFLGKSDKEQWAKNGEDIPDAKIELRKQAPNDPRMDPNSSHNKPFKRPGVVVQSDNIFDHTYNTPQDALLAAKYLKCGSNIHYHSKENVWMPCSMSISPGTDDLMQGRN